MTYTEVLLLIQKNGEKISTDRLHSVRTDRFLYVRNADGVWEQTLLPVKIEEELLNPIKIIMPE